MGPGHPGSQLGMNPRQSKSEADSATDAAPSFPGRSTRPLAVIGRGLILLSILAASHPLAMAQYSETFETPEKSWRTADHDCTLTLQQHARIFEQAHSGQACEYLQFRAGTGTFAHLVHAIPASRVIDELGHQFVDQVQPHRPATGRPRRVSTFERPSYGCSLDGNDSGQLVQPSWCLAGVERWIRSSGWSYGNCLCSVHN